MLFTLCTYNHILLCIVMYVITLYKLNISINYLGKLISSPFYEVFLSFCFENVHTKLMTLYKRTNRVDVFFDFVTTILLHEFFIKQACKSHFILDLENTQNFRLNGCRNFKPYDYLSR
jgi:hypothetical protein